MEIKIVQNQNEVYQKEKLLGEGAFGKAYLVKHKPTGESMVIKQMNIEHMSTKQKQETIKEAQILKSLNHPNIVNFKEVYITKNNKLKIVMEYAECGDIAKAIAQRKAKKQFFDEAHILDWFTQICLAIKHVHDRKILHRDIKGHNIFISKNNSLKLGDFGIARVLNMTHDKARTVVGTPYYLSPQIIQNKPYSFKSDIWSIGAVLYQLCALQPPFTANSLQMLALKIVKGEYASIPSQYTQQLKNLIKQMLTLDPNKRPNINEILKKTIITDRIRNFLTETKRIAQFSHTILHNQKVEIFANKLVQIQKQKMRVPSNQKNLQVERQKLKQEQALLQAARIKKKQEEKRKQQKKKQDQIRRRQEQIKRKEEEKKRRLIYEQQKKQQMQRQYQENIRRVDLAKQRKIEGEREYQRQIELAYLRKQKEQQQQKKRKQAQNVKKMNKLMQQDKKQQDFNELARKQYFENLQIRKRAQQRARREQQGYTEEPIKQQPTPISQANYHYQKRPQTKQQSRINSIEKKQNSSDLYNRVEKKKQPEPTEQELINAFCNPNYKKTSQNSRWSSKQIKDSQKKTNTAENKESVIKKESQSNKKIEQQRQKMRKDRQNYGKLKQSQRNQVQQKESEQLEVGKWSKKKSSEKQQKSTNISSEKQSPRFREPYESKMSEPTTQTQNQVHEFNEMIGESDNLFLDVKNPAQFDKYIAQLQQIVQGVQQKVDLLPEIEFHEQIKFREDDLFELSLTAQPKKQQQEIDTADADLDYFSNYSKLQTLRMQLQEAFGLQNFIQLYRCIEKQVNQKGIDGFNISEAIKEVGGNIDNRVANKNGTLLLTLVTLQDKMSYT